MFQKAITLSASKFVEKIASFLIIILLTYIFAQKEVGRFFYYFSLVSLTIPVMDFGLRKLLVLKWGKDDNESLISSIIISKLLLGFICWLIVLVVDLVINFNHFSPLAASLCFLTIFADEVGQIFRAPDHANEKYAFEIFVPLLSKILCLVTIFIFKDYLVTIENVLMIYAGWNIFSAIASSFSIFKYSPKLSTKHFRNNFKPYLKEGYAFSLTGFLVMMSFFVDSVILGIYSFEETGIYNCAFRIVLVFGILSCGFSHVLFSRLSAESKTLIDSKSHLETMVPLVFTLFTCIAIGTISLSSQAITFLYSEEFSEASIILVILSPFIILSSLSNIFAHTLEAHGLQRKVMTFNIISCSFNLITNLIFIPIWGMYAAAITTVLTEMINLTFCYLLLKNAGFNPFIKFPKVCRNLILIIIAAGVIAHFLPLLPGALIGAAVFIPLYFKIFKNIQKNQGEPKCVS